MNAHKSSMEPEGTHSSYLMHLALISKTIEAWLHSIPMTTRMAECLEGVADLADIEMDSFKKVLSKSDQITLEHCPSKPKQPEVNRADHNSILMNTPSMPSFDKPPSTLDVYLTPLDKIDNGLNVPEALRHLVNTQSDTFNTHSDTSSPTPRMPVVKQRISLYSSKSPENSSQSVLEGAESQVGNKRERAPEDNDGTDEDWAKPSPRRSARVSCSGKGVDLFTYPISSALRRVKKQKTHTSAKPNEDGQATLPNASAHVHIPPHSKSSLSTSITTTHSPVASVLLGEKPNSFWNKKIDLHLSISVQNQNVVSTKVSAIHKASLVLLNALAKGNCTQFNPDELLCHPVTFSSSGEPGIREWCQRAENQQLFASNKGMIWYQPQNFNFVTISNSSPSSELPIHERYLWETIKMFHSPNPRFLERSMHYVLAALVLIGTDADRILPTTELTHQASMSCGTRNAVTCWHHFKKLSSLQSSRIVDKQSSSRGGSIEDLDKFIVVIYSMIETFASIWASTTLDEEISKLKNLIESAASHDSVEAFTTRKDELTRTRSQIIITQNNLPALASFLCCGVRGLMIYPKDQHVFGPLRAINFLLITGDLAEQGQAVEETIWKRTQSYIVDFMKDVIQSSKEWVPCELNRYHLAKALFLDFSDYFLARDIRKILIPSTRNYKVSHKECT